MTSLSIGKTFSYFPWINSRPFPSRVSEKVAAEMGRLSSATRARAFVKTAGLLVPDLEIREANVANPVRVDPVVQMEPYYFPQVVLPKVNSEIAFGSALVNCLIPPDLSIEDSQRILGSFSRVVSLLSDRLDALPFAVITGNKTPMPRHELDQRGFRFFYSPEPNDLYKRIYELLQADCERLEARQKQETGGARLKKVTSGILALKNCKSGEVEVPHPMLAEVWLYAADTMLVDLR